MSYAAHATMPDHIAKRLEINAIARYAKPGMAVLDVGCGDGETLQALVHHRGVYGVGMDSSPTMVAHARLAARECAEIVQADIRGGVPASFGKYHMIYTERALINLKDWAEQRRAILDILDALVPGGLFVMCENSRDGLANINRWRHWLGLPLVVPPHFNRYLYEREVAATTFPGAELVETNNYSATYYFVSRVIAAGLWKWLGWGAPAYDNWLNQLAYWLRPVGSCYQGRIWVWRKL